MSKLPKDHRWRSRRIVILGESETPRIVLWLMHHLKFLKSERQAALFLIWLSLAKLAISILVVVFYLR